MGYLTDVVILNNRLIDYLSSLVIFILSVVILKVLEHVIFSKLDKLAASTKTSLDDFLVGVLKSTVVPFSYFGAFYFSVHALVLDPTLKQGLRMVILVILTFFVTKFVILFVNYGLELYLKKSKKSVSFENSIRGMVRVLRVVIWGVAIVFLLDNLGFKVSAVMAGLGIGGVAVALAAQAVLGDLFSYFAILFDKPFEIGDFIIVGGDYLGVVEHVGIKTTRITSLGGEQLVFSNTDLTNSRIRNYKRMQKRRVLFKLGVTYGTPLEKLQAIPGLIKDIIIKVPDTVFDRAHFAAYGDFNLVIEIVYYVIGPDYNKYMDIQQEINFAIKKSFEEMGIEFAFPTQTLYLNNARQAE